MAKKDPDEKPAKKDRSAERATALGKAFGRGHKVIRVPEGEVAIAAVTVGSDDICGWVDVQVEDAESGESHFRIVNPPLYAEDPNGDIVINGKRFVEDPVKALAQTIGMNGGARRRRRARGLR